MKLIVFLFNCTQILSIAFNFNIEIKKKEHKFIAIVSLKCIKNINYDFLWTDLNDILSS